MLKKCNLWCFFLIILLISTACASFGEQTIEIKPTPKVTENGEPTLEDSPTIPTNTASTNSSNLSSNYPTLENLHEGWSNIAVDKPSSCARGTPYSFFVRKTNSDKLLIYFEGGGSCYNAQTCQVGSNFFDDSIDLSQHADNPALKTTGVFALSDERNPFHDYNMVFVTYCTGDAFLGNKSVSYDLNGKSFQVEHRGYENTQNVLNWTFQNFSNPDSVFVIGCSAGTAGSFFHAPSILDHYPDTPVVFVGDSGGGFIEGPDNVAKSFGLQTILDTMPSEYEKLLSDDIMHTKLIFALPAQLYPEAKFALLDTNQDRAQEGLLQSFGIGISLADLIAVNLDDIRAVAPNLLSYTGPGDYHCITMDPEFYKYQVRDTLLVNWVANLANGEEVQNIGP